MDSSGCKCDWVNPRMSKAGVPNRSIAIYQSIAKAMLIDRTLGQWFPTREGCNIT